MPLFCHEATVWQPRFEVDIAGEARRTMQTERYGAASEEWFWRSVMSFRVCAATALVLAIAADTAIAADIGRGRSPYSAPVYAPAGMQSYSWMGPYLGFNVGYQWADTTNNPTKPTGVAGGVQGGYNWQSGQFVVGGETDLQLSAAEDTFAPWKFSNPWFGTLRGRAGVALNNVLLYGTGGVAYGGGRGEVIAGLSEARTHFGWAAGVGMEVGFTPRISARAEYLYVDLNDRNYTVVGTANGFESNLLRFGLNYRF
jgi:outer membrane immunogenic protein